MEFVEFDRITTAEWDDIVAQSDDGWVFSLADWLSMVTPIWNMQQMSFAVRENGKLIAVMPLHWIPMERRLSSGGWGHGCPSISIIDRQRVWRACWDKVDAIASELGATRITASISPICPSSLNCRWGVNPLVEVGFSDISTHTRIIDLGKDNKQLWLGLSKDARQKIKQARELGYTVRRCPWKDLVEDYYRVHVENYRRTGVHPHPRAYFEGIAAQPDVYFYLWVGFDPAGHPVAFHNDARFRTAAMYHTGCSETAHLKSGINYLLFWEAMCGEKSDGLNWYESGEAFPAAKEGKEKGLTEFKGKFGGELHRLFRGEKIIIASQPLINIPPPSLANESSGRNSIWHNWILASKELAAILPRRRFKKILRKILILLGANGNEN
jgi:hypothetical protein